MDAIDESCVQAVVTEASLVAGEGSDARYHLALTVGDAHADGDVWIDAYFFEYSSPLLRSLVSVVPRSKEIFENLRKLNTSEAKPFRGTWEKSAKLYSMSSRSSTVLAKRLPASRQQTKSIWSRLQNDADGSPAGLRRERNGWC